MDNAWIASGVALVVMSGLYGLFQPARRTSANDTPDSDAVEIKPYRHMRSMSEPDVAEVVWVVMQRTQQATNDVKLRDEKLRAACREAGKVPWTHGDVCELAQTTAYGLAYNPRTASQKVIALAGRSVIVGGRYSAHAFYNFAPGEDIVFLQAVRGVLQGRGFGVTCHWPDSTDGPSPFPDETRPHLSVFVPGETLVF